jgi:hypothetical protein
MAKNKTFKDYTIGWLWYLLFNLIIGVIVGGLLGIIAPNMGSMTLSLLSITLSLIVLFSVSEWQRLNFLLLLLYNVVLWIILFMIAFVLIVVVAL